MSTDIIETGNWTISPTGINSEIAAIGEAEPLLEGISSVITAISTTPLGESGQYTVESSLPLANTNEKIMMAEFSQIGTLTNSNEFAPPYDAYKMNPKQTQIYGYVNLKSSDLDAMIETIDAHEFEHSIRNAIVGKLYESVAANKADADVVKANLAAVDAEASEAENSLEGTVELLSTLNVLMSTYAPDENTVVGTGNKLMPWQAFNTYAKEMDSAGLKDANLGSSLGTGKAMNKSLSYFTTLPLSFFSNSPADPTWSNTRNFLQALLESEKCMTTGVSSVFLHSFSSIPKANFPTTAPGVGGARALQSTNKIEVMSLSKLGGWSSEGKIQPKLNDSGHLITYERLYDKVKAVRSTVSSLTPMGQVLYFLNIIDAEIRLSAGLGKNELKQENTQGRIDSDQELRGSHAYIRSLLGTAALTTDNGAQAGKKFDLIENLKDTTSESFANLALSNLAGGFFNDPDKEFLITLDTNKDAFGPDKVSHTPEDIFKTLLAGNDNNLDVYNNVLNRTNSRADSINEILLTINNSTSSDAVMELFIKLISMVANISSENHKLRTNVTTAGNGSNGPKRIATEAALFQIYATTDDLEFKRYMLDCIVARVSQKSRSMNTQSLWPRFANNGLYNEDEVVFGPDYADSSMLMYFDNSMTAGPTGDQQLPIFRAKRRIILETTLKTSGNEAQFDKDGLCSVSWTDIMNTLLPPHGSSGGYELSTSPDSPFNMVFNIVNRILERHGADVLNPSHGTWSGLRSPATPDYGRHSNPGLAVAPSPLDQVTKLSEMDSSTLVSFAVEAVSIMINNFCPVYFAKWKKTSTSATIFGISSPTVFTTGRMTPDDNMQDLLIDLHKWPWTEKWTLYVKEESPAAALTVDTLKSNSLLNLLKFKAHLDSSQQVLNNLGQPNGYQSINTLSPNNYSINTTTGHLGAFLGAYPELAVIDFSSNFSLSSDSITPNNILSAMATQVSTRYTATALARLAGSYFKIAKKNAESAQAFANTLNSGEITPMKTFINSSQYKEFTELISVSQLNNSYQRLKDINESSDKSNYKITRTNSYVRKAQKFLFQFFKSAGPDVFNEYRPTAIRNIKFTNGAVLFSAAPARMLVGYNVWPLNAFVKVVVKRHDQIRPFLDNSFQDRVLIYPTDISISMEGISLAFQPEDTTSSPPTNFLELVRLAYYTKVNTAQSDGLHRGLDLISTSHLMVTESRLANLMADFLLKRYYEERLKMSFSEEDVQTRPDKQKKFSPKVLAMLKMFGQRMGIPGATIDNLFPIVDNHITVPSKNSEQYIEETSYNSEVTYSDSGEGVIIWKYPNISEVDIQILTDFFNTKPFMVDKVKDHVFTPSLFDKVYASFCPLDNFEIIVDDITPISDNAPESGKSRFWYSITKASSPYTWDAQVFADVYSFDKTGDQYRSKVNIDKFSLSISMDDNVPIPTDIDDEIIIPPTVDDEEEVQTLQSIPFQLG